MSFIATRLLRAVPFKRPFILGLQPQIESVKSEIHKAHYATTVVTTKNVSVTELDEDSERKMNNAARMFMERAREYDEMIEDAQLEYRLGMRHLANMMGEDPELFTQKDANEAIEYLFPSGIYDPKARPFMRPPEEVFPPRKRIQFDRTGRPFHYMYFTGFPNFYDLCHQANEHLQKLNQIEDKANRNKQQPNAGLQLNLIDSDWLTKELLEKKILETIKDEQYEEFLAVMQRLLEHPYSYECKDFIMQNRRNLIVTQKGREIIEPKIGADGRKYVTTCECRFKSAIANVTVISPGTGKIEINGQDINYFKFLQPKETVAGILPAGLVNQ